MLPQEKCLVYPRPAPHPPPLPKTGHGDSGRPDCGLYGGRNAPGKDVTDRIVFLLRRRNLDRCKTEIVAETGVYAGTECTDTK